MKDINMKILKLLIILCYSTGMSTYAYCEAETSALPEIYKYKGVALTFENDVLTYKIRDRYYTNGVFLTYKNSYSENSQAFIYRTTNNILDIFMFSEDMNNSKNSFQFLLGQLMITPEDITTSEVNLDDQPYAGILYGQADIFTIYSDQSQAISIKIGVSGPESGAEAMQEIVHDLIDNEAPVGWDGQIPNRFFVNLSLQNNYRMYKKDFKYFSFDTSVNWGVDIGNLETAARTVFCSFYTKRSRQLTYGPILRNKSIASEL